MMHRNAQTLGDAIREFFEDNAELRGKILEIRVIRAWGEILGPMVAQYTRNIYVKDKVLYVSLTSSVLRTDDGTQDRKRFSNFLRSPTHTGGKFSNQFLIFHIRVH